MVLILVLGGWVLSSLLLLWFVGVATGISALLVVLQLTLPSLCGVFGHWEEVCCLGFFGFVSFVLFRLGSPNLSCSLCFGGV